MSLLPLILSEVLEDATRRPRSFGDLYDQHFGLGMLNEDLLNPRLISVPLSAGYLRPYRHLATGRSGVSNVVSNKDSFRVNLDVQQFKPEELSVKVVDNYLVVEAKHEERSDEHGFVSRQFTRRYLIPSNINANRLQSSLSSDGILMLEAPVKETESAKERNIPITATNQPALKQKQPAAVQPAGDKMEEEH